MIKQFRFSNTSTTNNGRQEPTKNHNGSSDPMYNLKRNQSPLLENTLPAKFIKSAANLISARNRGQKMKDAVYGNVLTQLVEDMKNQEDDFKERNLKFIERNLKLHEKYGNTYTPHHDYLMKLKKRIVMNITEVIDYIYQKKLEKYNEEIAKHTYSPNNVKALHTKFMENYEKLKMIGNRQLHNRIKKLQDTFFENMENVINKKIDGNAFYDKVLKVQETEKNKKTMFEDIQKELNSTAGGKSTKRTRKHKSKRLQSRRK